MGVEQQVIELQTKMTLEDGKVNPGALRAFGEVYLHFGLPGVQALYNAGHDTSSKVWVFYNDQCHCQMSELASRLNLK